MDASSARLMSNVPIRAGHFDDCRNAGSGAVFVIASGSSAKGFPFESFADIPMITMNGAISMFIDTPIKPFFYVCTDRDFSNQQPELFAEALRRSERVALWEDHYASAQVEAKGELYFLRKPPKARFLERLRKDHELVRNHPFPGSGRKPLGFSKNLQRGFFDARTVAYVALQIAYHAGFNQVFLVGVDLNQNAGRFYENHHSKLSPCGLDQHFESRILPSFQLVADSVVGDEFAVYNLSPTSRLPRSVAPYKSLEQVQAMLRAG
ncbi:lipopolysaccharide biosynthesis protein [Pseudomonas sp. H9]|uniref:lipopolysaccharide biosynthesis protein n=1 Tax=Pseudomonas sp. H9 TaxID=483968 RepID=UPI00105773CF|nr:lipopolysaccharide biosynthesis protein [Pseudomonas sp. H9]TDF82945.1 lipopolysaccharide biosynthesis protein [Pseudomonas sp. H9]